MALVTLRIVDGSDRGRAFDHLPTPVTIGREEGNSIQLNDERVSRFHIKIQEDHDKLVLTDLESTNGTKVNGEDISLRILRHGDMIMVGRSVLLYGSSEQIAARLAKLRGEELQGNGSGLEPGVHSLEHELSLCDDSEMQATLHLLEPPELPERLSPGQAAQIAEMLEYFHIRLRHLIASVKEVPESEDVTLEQRQWQNLLDLQGKVAEYLRSIGEPPEEAQ